MCKAARSELPGQWPKTFRPSCLTPQGAFGCHLWEESAKHIITLTPSLASPKEVKEKEGAHFRARHQGVAPDMLCELQHQENIQ
jgi:hypothetical protein